jgi:hypothetical protein
MKNTGCLSILFIVLLSFTACTKKTVTSTAPVMKTYPVKDATGAVAGNFTIGSTKEGISIVTVELEQKSHRHGTVYTALICLPGQENCYAKLDDINAVIGYGETLGIREQSTGRNVTADELFQKTGYQLKIRSNGGIIASGVIE